MKRKCFSALILLALSSALFLQGCSSNKPEDSIPLQNEISIENENIYKDLSNEELDKKADLGDIDAIIEKASRLYANPEATEKDYEDAVKYFKKAAQKGNAEGQYHLGFAYLQGLGIEANPQKAYEYFVLSAEQNYIEAEFCAGYMCELGIGTGEDPNYEKAAEFYRKAAEKGHDMALCFLGDFSYFGLGGILKQILQEITT